MLIACVGAAGAHGGLAMEQDYCKLRVGRYVMHFVGYQPDSASGPKEFCEDIPATGATIIVLDFVDDALRDLPIELRIIRDTGGTPDNERDTVVHIAPMLYPGGSALLDTRFEQAGDYVGLVSISGQPGLNARFPFSVGKKRYGALLFWAIAVVASGAGLYLYGQRKRDRRAINAR